MTKRVFVLRMTALLLVVIPSFAWGQDKTSKPRATIRPSLVRLTANSTQPFKIVLEPQRLRSARVAQKVRWNVNGIPGGNAQIGTIDASGIYHAPAKSPRAAEIHIGAEVEEAENQLLWATVILGDKEPSYHLARRWRSDVNEEWGIQKPLGFALDANDTLLLADTKKNVVVRFTRDGRFLHKVGAGTGNKPGYFMDVRDITVDNEGKIFVSDERTGPPRIQVFDPQGNYLYAFGQKGAGPGQLFRTGGMMFSASGILFVVDIDTMRINQYEKSGNFLGTWDDDGEHLGQLNAPYGVFVDRNGDVFVAGYYGPCQKFSQNGVFLSAFASPDPPEGPVGFQSISGDRWGNVYLAARLDGESPGDFDPEHGKKVFIYKYNNNGDFITRFPLPQGELGETRMAVDEQDQLYVVFQRKNEAGVEIYSQR
ncbi:MAG TPA: NHL repeat-containing protein [Candidatus Hydrogenedentes bacterium]|nr:NHL repeat-containing protein [Candidatus Hydrogenedentota bacterium]HOL76110.1 NHL repeat-containing protein [Candidatus Hydrogenedentota bacterium]HPO84724.1 NHL repeat-containing protein [Candidatus Hydrogenedentota bacterium]